MRRKVKLNQARRVLALFLAVVMVMSMVPLSVFAAIPGTVTTDIGKKDFVVGTSKEFTITTTANDDAGTMVIGTAVFSDPSAIEKLEYYEVQDGNWYELAGDFGPSTGFPMSDATSKFRVTFKKAGIYSVEIFIKSVEDGSVVCSTTATALVNGFSSFTTDASNKTFVVGESTEFTFTTVANEDAGKMVIGTAEFSNPDAIDVLEYYEVQNDTWYPLEGDFGPATGFPMSNATSTFRVTFKQAGTYTLTAYMKEVDSGETLCFAIATITVKDRSAISFTDESIEIRYSDVNATNGSLVDNVTGAEYTYKSDDENVVKVNEYGILTPTGIGETTITVTRKENVNYMAASATYTVKVVAGVQAPLVFGEANPNAIFVGDIYENVATGGSIDDITYKSSDETIAIVDKNGKVTALRVPVGKESAVVTITASIAADDYYEAISVEYTLTINRAPQTNRLIFEKGTAGQKIKYGEAYKNAVSGGDTTPVTYKSSDETIAKVDANGNVTALKAGTVTITASVPQSEEYEEQTLSYELVIDLAGQTVTFEKGNTNIPVITYGDSYQNSASAKTEITYESSDPSIADVDANGNLTINKFGTVIITATAKETDQYKVATSCYTITIEKAEQSITFEHPEYEMVNGDKSFVAPTVSAQGAGDGEIIYTIDKNEDGVVGAIDSKTGALTFTNKTGKVTIRATKLTDDRYKEATATYTLTIEDAQLGENVFHTLVGEKIDAASEWYAGNVSIKAVDGYLLSYAKAVDTAKWENTLEDAVTADGTNDVIFYVKHVESGKIYEAQTVTVRKDATDPEATIKHEGLTGWEKLLSIITLGLWEPENMNFTIEGGDTTSGVKKVEYYVVGGTTEIMSEDTLDALADDEWTEYAGSIKVAQDKIFVVYAKVTDNAGRHIYATTNGIVFDRTAVPEDKIVIDVVTEDSKGFYGDDVELNIKIDDALPSSGINTVYYEIFNNNVLTQGHGIDQDNGVIYQFAVENPEYVDLVASWNSATDNKNVIVDSQKNNSDNVKVIITVIDNAGNKTAKEIFLKICTNKPTIDVSYIEDPASVPVRTHEGVTYYEANRIAKIVITGRTSVFAASNAPEFVITEIKGDTEQGRTYEVVGCTTSEVEGNPDAATHTYLIKFNGSANYEFSFDYNDVLGNNCSYNSGKFVIDHEDPTASVTIDGDNTWTKILETLTFGLWKNTDVTVKVTSNDATSPIYKIEMYKTASSEILTSEQLEALYKEGGFYKYEDFTVADDEKFVAYIRVEDCAGHYIFINSDGYVVDKTQASITLTPDNTDLTHNNIPLYNGDVNVLINVVEKKDEAYSGIKEVKYWVTCDGAVSQPEVILYSFNNTTPKYEDLLHEFTKTVTIDSEKNNSCNVVLYVTVTDNAGNVKTESVAVDIDITAPTITVDFDNNATYKVVDGKGYFPAGRTATVVITERTAHFDAAKATRSIKIKAVDATGATVIADCSTLVSAWTTEGNGNAATHTATIDFTADANYEFTLSYEDLATKSCKYEEVKFADGTVVPRYFAVDKTAPTGTVTAGELGTWDKLIEILTFGLWSKDTVDVTGTTNDVTTPIESVSYYKTSDTTAKTEEELKAITSWTAFNGETGITVPADEQFVVYIRIVDYAGNVTYISTNGIIVDDTIPAVESVKPEIAITPEPAHGIYNSNVTIAVSVVDPKTGDTNAYAGLKEIRYEIYSLGAKTQDGVLYSFDTANPTHGQLQQAWSKADAIVVDKDLNNSNDVKIVVYAVDNAGNSNKAECNIKIDITAPTIDVTYDNNDGDASFTESVYFKANRTAKIVVTERNFDPAMIKLVITNTDGYVPEISSWTTVGGAGNGDGTTHTAYVAFDKDGDYTFDISCTDTATNANTVVDYANSLAPRAFTVDKITPVVSVVYDNNDVLNGNYYKAQRIATITITEHNFETGRIKIALKATDDGKDATLPTVSNWTSNGDVHTATITYAADSLYVFDFDYNDKAGNATADIAEQTFYVDKTNPVLKIEKIVDESANNDEGNIGFVMTATDTNFDVFTTVLTAVVKNGNTFETKQLEIGETTDIKNGKVFTVTNIDADGIYRITCTIVDKAGNAYSEVTLEKADGSTYVEKRAGEDTLVTFSVNRDGSTFEVDENTVKVVEQYYVQNVENDVVIVEINADPLMEYTVTLNGRALEKDKDYIVTEEGGNGVWMKYTYKVNKDLFADEGEYKLVVSSKDKADNDAFSDVKEAAVEFVVDRTAPVVTVSGIANDGRYQTDKQLVTLIPTDDGGALKTLIVNMVDEDGKVIKEVINLIGEALTTELEANGGKIIFEIAEGLYQNVQIICSDFATDETEATNTHDTTIKNVSVSSSEFMIFWANKPLRWGAIAGVSAVAIALAVFIILRKKKSKEA